MKGVDIVKKTVSVLCALLLCLSAPAVYAGGITYSWYCKHCDNEAIPPLDAQMSFIEKYGGFYVDHSASGQNKTIYLTFDAGYENGNVEKILDTLREKEVKGSFFILENIAKRNPALVKRMAEDGHLVCNHTALHRDMTTVTSYGEFVSELDRLNDVVKEKTGGTVAHYFRPPEGRFTEETLKWADEAGYKTVFWSFAYADWDNNRQPDPSSALEKILRGAHPGEILLLHPTSSTNASILGELIDRLRERGYVFKTLDQLGRDLA